MTERVNNPRWNAEIASIEQELQQHLTINTLGRLADFKRFADDEELPDENKMALLISGWIVGPGSASQNLAEAISLIRSRDLVADYLRSKTEAERTSILERLAQEEGGTPTRVAEILKQMKPPIETKPQEGRPVGYYQLTTGPKDAAVEYEIQLPEQYDPYRRYPAVVTLHGAGRTPAQQIDWWSGVYHEKKEIRLGQGARHGYIVIAPKWTRINQRKYEYSAREHAAVLASLRDACRRFSIDTDRVFLSGHSTGGDAAWDIGLAHPDLWAGVIPIVAVADHGPNSPKYVSQYWENAEYVPMYFVAGELDGDKMTRNGRDLDRYMTRPNYDVMLVEYIGRGHEHFYDEIHRIFEWMQLHRRDFYRPEFECVSMRAFDSFFWCLELEDMPAKSMVAPLQWPPPRGTRPATNSFRRYLNNRVGVKTGAARAIVWLAPGWVDLNRRVSITVNGKTRGHNVGPDLQTMLHDARTRGDRLHPFWAKIEVETGKRR
jgi:predicted esterase